MGTNEKEYKKKQQQMKDMFDQSNGFHHHLFDVCLALGSILTSPRIPQKHNPILQSAFQNHAPRHHCFSDIIIQKQLKSTTMKLWKENIPLYSMWRLKANPKPQARRADHKLWCDCWSNPCFANNNEQWGGYEWTSSDLIMKMWRHGSGPEELITDGMAPPSGFTIEVNL